MSRDPVPNAQRCQAKVAQHPFNAKLKGRCGNYRRYRIGKKELCGKHACLEALHWAVNSGAARKIPVAIPLHRQEVEVVS